MAKRSRKKFLRVGAALVALLFIAACGKAAVPDIPDLDYDISVTSDETSGDAGSDVSASEGDSPAAGSTDAAAEELLHIVWGWGQDFSGDTKISEDAAIITYMEEKFDVNFDLKYFKYGETHTSTPPDLFVTHARYAYAAGATRTIPRSMIEQYAPRYAEVLTREPYGWEFNKATDQEAVLGLNFYDSEAETPGMYSIYRLDWLEKTGFSPPGEVVPLHDGLYFTDQPFTQAQFVDIMRAFTFDDPDGDGTPDTYGFVLPDNPDGLSWCNTTLAGMWGLNFNNMNDDGTAKPYFASERYKDFLQFLSGLYDEGLAVVRDNNSIWADDIVAGQVGWWCDNPGNIGMYRQTSRGTLFEKEPEAKLLITPPEIGASGQQGVASNTVLPFNKNSQWVISAQVSDAKLAKILSIFDELTFDPETWMVARYGFEDEDYHWEDKPYESRVLQSQQEWLDVFYKGAYRFYTFTYDGVAGKHVYQFGNNALLTFATSDAGRRMVLPPYKEDVTGVFYEQSMEINNRLGSGALGQAVVDFYTSAVTGQGASDDAWDAYIATLNDNGLLEGLALLEQYPTVNP